MSLATLMLEQLAAARRIVEDGQEVVPAWRIMTPEGTYRIFMRFDITKPEQCEHAIALIGRFMVWKMATSFLLTAEIWLGAEGEDAFFIIGVSRLERLAALQRIKRGNGSSGLGLAFDVDWPPITECQRQYLQCLAPDPRHVAAIFVGNDQYGMCQPRSRPIDLLFIASEVMGNLVPALIVCLAYDRQSRG